MLISDELNPIEFKVDDFPTLPSQLKVHIARNKIVNGQFSFENTLLKCWKGVE